MTKNKVGLIVFAVGLFSSAVFAQENHGFHVAADLNYGVGIAAYDGESESGTGLGLSLRAGYELSEQWIMMLDLFTSSYSITDIDTTNNGFMLGGQYYFTDNAYIRPSLGFSKIKVKTEFFGETLEGETDLGLALGLAAGYQVRINDVFTAGPTARLIYNRVGDSEDISNGTFWNIGVGAEIKASF